VFIFVLQQDPTSGKQNEDGDNDLDQHN
jgi:hypothetical protein